MSRKSKSASDNKEKVSLLRNPSVVVAIIGGVTTIIGAVIANIQNLHPAETPTPAPTGTVIFPTQTVTNTASSTSTLSPTATETLTPSPTPIPITDTPSASASPDASCIGWEFNTDGNFEGWRVNLRVNNLRVSGGTLHGEFNKFDPSLLSPQKLNIGTSKYTVLTIRYSIISDDDAAQVMWNPENSKNFIIERHMLYDIRADGEWRTVEVYVGSMAGWTDIETVNTLRIDPVHDASSGTFAYDYIRLCP